FTDHLVHFRQDVQTCMQRLLKGSFHDLFGDTFDLDVHLQRGYATRGTGHLEVHVAQVVFVTQDVGQNSEAVVFLHQAHGDAGNRCFQRYARVHQRQAGTTYGRHRAGTVGFGDLGNHTQGVGEGFRIRQYCSDTAAGQTAVADFAATGSAYTTRFAYRVGREVVVQHEVVF